MPKIEFFCNIEKCCAKVNPDAQIFDKFKIVFLVIFVI